MLFCPTDAGGRGNVVNKLKRSLRLFSIVINFLTTHNILSRDSLSSQFSDFALCSVQLPLQVFESPPPVRDLVLQHLFLVIHIPQLALKLVEKIVVLKIILENYRTKQMIIILKKP